MCFLSLSTLFCISSFENVGTTLFPCLQSTKRGNSCEIGVEVAKLRGEIPAEERDTALKTLLSSRAILVRKSSQDLRESKRPTGMSSAVTLAHEQSEMGKAMQRLQCQVVYCLYCQPALCCARVIAFHVGNSFTLNNRQKEVT